MKYSILVHYTMPDAKSRCESTLWIEDAKDVGDAYVQGRKMVQHMDGKSISLSACMPGHHVMCGEIIRDKKNGNG